MRADFDARTTRTRTKTATKTEPGRVEIGRARPTRRTGRRRRKPAVCHGAPFSFARAHVRPGLKKKKHSDREQAHVNEVLSTILARGERSEAARNSQRLYVPEASMRYLLGYAKHADAKILSRYALIGVGSNGFR